MTAFPVGFLFLVLVSQSAGQTVAAPAISSATEGAATAAVVIVDVATTGNNRHWGPLPPPPPSKPGTGGAPAVAAGGIARNCRAIFAAPVSHAVTLPRRSRARGIRRANAVTLPRRSFRVCVLALQHRHQSTFAVLPPEVGGACGVHGLGHGPRTKHTQHHKAR
eukprot:CAMPEP_0171836256 /NCGR_PEP_ID=MMETSP0992-20121227/11467_1 /TAXON_ID=483369 /ORGANISM="non described non described, Strain CCMP2098" /LENGTH=163 /DNA_ID=CAMNT_0012452229 /DNA_START=152 /DNA_END=644 /DNA_ORIENTATION=-